MRLRYVGMSPFKIVIGDEIRHLQEGDEIDVKPWKIRSSRLRALFEVAETDPDKLTRAEKKHLKKLRDFGDSKLYKKKEKTPEEWAEELEKEYNKS